MASRNDQFTRNLELIHRSLGMGGFGSQAFEMLYGVNYRAAGIVLPNNTDQTGFTFWTRPDMNLQEENITQDRRYSPMISRDPITYPRALRALLDPWGSVNSGYPSALVNPRQAFLTPLCNTCTSVSGHPDNVTGTFTSQEGIANEAWGMIDGIYEVNGPWDMTATFNNIEGGLIGSLFGYWGRYASDVYQGHLMPYPWNNMISRLDYVTRAYRFVMDPARQYIQKYSAPGYCFPATNPNGGDMDFDSNDNYGRANDRYTVQFKCFGAIYNDPMLLDDFNRTVAKFNPDLRIANQSTLYKEEIRLVSSNYYRVTPEQRDYMNFYAYPLAHPYTQELCWFVEKDVYNNIMNSLGNGSVANLDYTVPSLTNQRDANNAQGYFSGAFDKDQ